jgi:hypothetical protein
MAEKINTAVIYYVILTLENVGTVVNYHSILITLSPRSTVVGHTTRIPQFEAGSTKGRSINVPLTSCLTRLESAEGQLTIFVFICKTD